MKHRSKTAERGEPIVLKKNIMSRVLYWIFMGLSFATMLTSLIIFFASGFIGKETTFNQVFMCLMSILMLNIPLLLERKFKLYIPGYITIVTYCLIFFHFVLGEVYRAYDSVKIFDKVLHTTSGVIISLLSFSIISILNNMQRTKIKLSPFFVVLFTFCFTMTSEYLWELIEYASDTLFGTNMQRWQDSLVLAEGSTMPSATAPGTFVINGPRGNGLVDTMGDMFVNILGCLGVCIYAYIGMKLKPDWFTARVMLTKTDIEALAESGKVVVDEKIADIISEPEDEAKPVADATLTEAVSSDPPAESEKAAEDTAEPDPEEPALPKSDASGL